MKTHILKRPLCCLLTIAMILSLCIAPASAAAASDYDAILNNCSVTLMQDGKERTDPFRENETSVDVKVKLDSSVAKCYLTIFAYASNTAFDPDGSHNIRLWGDFVTDGAEVTCPFNTANLPLKPGYSIIACLNVPVDTDFYRPVNSAPLKIVDENGQGFEDYVYPDASIAETALQPGATSLHVNLTADPRLFQAAKDDKTSLNLAVAQYPADADFDFESEEQVTLYSQHDITAPLVNQEVPLSEPLKEGYRVRAVVYWEQNVELQLVKGNDYEPMFHCPDDSLIVGGAPVKPTKDFTVALKGDLTADSKTVTFTVAANDPKITLINAAKLFKSDDLKTPVAQKFGQKPGEISFDLPAGSVQAGDKLCLVLTYNNAESTFTSDAFVVAAPAKPAQDFTVALKGDLTADSKTVTFTVAANDPKITLINAVKLFKNDDLKTPVAQKFGQKPGEISFDLPAGSVQAGDKLCLVLTYNNGDATFTSDAFPVSGAPVVPVEDSITMTGPFTTASRSAKVTVTGCDAFKGGYLILTTGPASNKDADSRTQIASVSFTGANTYEITFRESAVLKPGETILPHLYRYDSAADRTMYKYGDPVVITDEGGPVEPVEDSITMTGPFTTASRSAKVTVTGCDAFKGGYLFLTTGPASNKDADSRTQIARVSFTGANTYEITFNEGAVLKPGETILPHLYRYDSAADRTMYKYGEPVVITDEGGQTITPEVSIATQKIPADRTDLWVVANFDPALTGTLTLYTYEGDTFSDQNPIYSAAISPKETSQKITFGAGKLTAGHRLTAVLTLSDGTKVQSDAKVIQVVPEKEKPTVTITDKAITLGDSHVNAAVTLDPSVSSARYTLYQFTSDTLNKDTAQALTSGTVYRSYPKMSMNVLNKLVLDAKLQVVLTVDGKDYFSNILTVQPSPDWGTPSIALDTASVSSDAKSIPVQVTYSDEYLSLGDAFYCDVTLYQFDGKYTDDEFVEKEMWETTATRIGQVNSRLGDETQGTINVPLLDSVQLKPGDRVIAKLRLPHAEWEDAEEDFVSLSVPVLAPGETLPDACIVLYNLGDETARGHRLHNILDTLKIPYNTASSKDLNQTLGYLAGMDGFEPSDKPFTGKAPNAEFMLMCHLSEAQLDRFLNAMTEDGLRINHKAMLTPHNQDVPLIDFMGLIDVEHDTFNGQIQLDKMVKTAEALTEEEYGTAKDWDALQTAIKEAKSLLGTYEPAPESLTASYERLKDLYLSVTGQKELAGDAFLTVKAEADGTYSLTANMKNDTPDQKYTYRWRTGETTQTITGVSAQKLIGSTVTITADGYFGSRTAQLEVPAAPVVTTSAGQDSLTLTWTAPAEADNRPLPTSYTVWVYQNDTLIQTVTDAQSGLTLTGLTADTEYSIRVAAISPVGRSDLAMLTAKTAAVPTAPTFVDVTPDDWFFQDVEFMVEQGLMNGVGGDRFAPNSKTTRGMVVTMLWRLEGCPKAETEHSFSDVSQARYYNDAISWAAEKQIVNGITEDRFGPENPVTREQLAAILYRCAGSPAVSDTALNFVDADQISTYAEDALHWAVDTGIIEGLENNILKPQGTALRAQVATMFARFIRLDV